MIFLGADNDALKITTSSIAGIDYYITFGDAPTPLGLYETTAGKITAIGTEALLVNSGTKHTKFFYLISIKNTSPSVSNTILITKVSGGTSYQLTPSVTLLAGEAFYYINGEGWIYYAADGTIKSAAVIDGNTAGGDLSGTYPNPSVIKLLGNAIPANSLGYLFNDGSGNLIWNTAPALKNSVGLYAQATTVTVASTAAETDILSSNPSLAANFFNPKGVLNIKFIGYHSGISSPSLRICVYIGSVIILDTGTIGSGNSTNAYFEIDGTITCRSVGVGGTFSAQGRLIEGTVSTNTNSFAMQNLSTVVINTTLINTLRITAQWTPGSPSNSLSITDGYIVSTGNN